MVIGISPLVDFAFKLMLGSPLHTGVTIHFLNSILTGQPRITRVVIKNPILDKQDKDDKLSVLDILATDEHGRSLNIEMQTSLVAGMWQRLSYYVSAVYVGQLYEGNNYADLRPAISICVLSESMFPKSRELHLDFRLRECGSGLILTDDIQIHLLQLKNLRTTADNVYHASAAERWAFFLQYADKLSLEQIRRLFPDKEFAEAAGVLEMISQTPEQYSLYNARLKFQRDEAARLTHAAIEGEARGEARGVRLGRIMLLQEQLGIRPSTIKELAACDDVQLNALEEQLRSRQR